MQQYQHYTVEDFLKDERFIRWVKAPTPETALFWEQWLERHPEKRETLDEARQMVQMVHFRAYKLSAQDKDALWDAIERKRRQSSPLPAQPARLVFLLRGWAPSRWAAVGAGILLCAALLYGLLQSQAGPHYATAYGETRKITLPDGSVVTLNAHSSLRLSAGWNATAPREVWLEGEAFFAVVKKPGGTQGAGTAQVPFIVHTSDVDVEVLGTEFNVNNRREMTRVILTSGKVKLNIPSRSEAQPLYMQPGEAVALSDAGKNVSKTAVDPTLYTAWVNKKLVFDNTPLSEVARIIEDTYGLRVVFADRAQARRKIRGSIPTEDVDVLLAALSGTFNLTVEKKPDHILIK